MTMIGVESSIVFFFLVFSTKLFGWGCSFQINIVFETVSSKED